MYIARGRYCLLVWALLASMFRCAAAAPPVPWRPCLLGTDSAALIVWALLALVFTEQRTPGFVVTRPSAQAG